MNKAHYKFKTNKFCIILTKIFYFMCLVFTAFLFIKGIIEAPGQIYRLYHDVKILLGAAMGNITCDIPHTSQPE